MKTKIGIYILLSAFTGILFLVMKDIMPNPSKQKNKVVLHSYSYNKQDYNSLNSIEHRALPLNQKRHLKIRGFKTEANTAQAFVSSISKRDNYNNMTSYDFHSRTATSAKRKEAKNRTKTNELLAYSFTPPNMLGLTSKDEVLKSNITNNQPESSSNNIDAGISENLDAPEKAISGGGEDPPPEGAPLGEGIVLFLILSLFYITYLKVKATRLQ